MKSSGVLPVIPVTIWSGSKALKTFALCDSGVSMSFVDESLIKTLNLTGQPVDLNVAGIHGTSDITQKRIRVRIGDQDGKVREDIIAYSHPNVNAENRTYNIKKLKETYPHLSVLKDSTVNLKDVKVILGQDCYHLHRAIDYRKCGNTKPWAVQTKLGWMLSGPLIQQESAKLVTESLFAAELDPLAGQMKTRWSRGLYALNCSVSRRFQANNNKSQDIFVVERNWKKVSTKSFHLEIKQVWQEEMQLVAGDHNIVQQKENKEFSVTEEQSEHKRVAITSNLQISEEFSVKLDLLKENVDVASVRQHVEEKQPTEMQAMTLAAIILTLAEGKKCSQLDKKIEFVKECHVELHEFSRGKAMYRRHSNDLLKRNQPSEENTSDGTKAVKMSFCRRHDVELKEKMPDKIILNDSENRNNWLGNRNSGMDAVAQANPNVYTQLRNGHSKQIEKRAWKFEHTTNLLHGMVESVQLTTGILYAKIVSLQMKYR